MLLKNLYELLEVFSINPKDAGAMDFCEVCYRLNAGTLFPDMPDMGGLGAIVRVMMRERKCSPRFFYGRMKRALRPLLEADDGTLEALGLAPEGRTTTAMALAVAAWMMRS